MKDKLLTTREVSQILNISEKDIIELTMNDKICHFKVAGEFLRFKKEDVVGLKKEIQKKFNIHKEISSPLERWSEILYFDDFYIVSFFIILVLVWIIVKG